MTRFPFCSTRISKVGKCAAFQLWTPMYFIESLDYCVQYWKQKNQVDCEWPIRDMAAQNFHVGTGWVRDND